MAVPVVPLIVLGVGALATAIGANKTSSPTTQENPNERRTRNDYYGTSFPNGFQPAQPIVPISPIDTYNAVNPYTAVQGLNPIEAWDPTSYQYIAPTTNYYDDPYQINSLADVIFNKEAKDLALEDNGFDWATNIPVLQELIVAIDYGVSSIKDTVSTVKEEGIGAAAGQLFMDVLWNAGETLDIVYNPIKGAAIDGWDGFVNGIGAGSDGRVNYNIDTGNTALDITLEIIGDPLNVLSFGSSSAIKSAAKTAASSADDVLAAVIKNTADEANTVLNKAATRAQKTLTSELASQYMYKGSTEFASTYKMFNQLGIADEVTKKVISETTDAMTEAIGRNVLKGVSTINKVVNATDEALLMSTPIGWSIKGVGATIDGVRSINRSLIKRSTNLLDETAVKVNYNDTIISVPTEQGITEVNKNINSKTLADAASYKYNFKYLPDEQVLIKQAGMIKTNTPVEYLVNLYDAKLITKKTLNILTGTGKLSDDFTKYYYNTLKPSGDAVLEVNNEIIKRLSDYGNYVNSVIDNDTTLINNLNKIVDDLKTIVPIQQYGINPNTYDNLVTDILSTPKLTVEGYQKAQLYKEHAALIRRIGLDLEFDFSSVKDWAFFEALLKDPNAKRTLDIAELELYANLATLKSNNATVSAFRNIASEIKNIQNLKMIFNEQAKVKAVSSLDVTLDRLGKAFELTEKATEDFIKEYTTDVVDFDNVVMQDISRLTQLQGSKTSKAYTVFKTVLESNNDAVVKELIEESAKENTSNSTINLLRILNDNDMLGTVQSDAKHILNTLQAHKNYTDFLGNIGKYSGSRNEVEAFIDWFAGFNRADMDAFIKEYVDETGMVDLDLMQSKLDFHTNGAVFSGYNKNTVLARIFGRDIDASAAHTSLYDSKITADNYVDLMKEQGKPLQEGTRFITYDLETSGLKVSNGATILNIGANVMEIRNGTAQVVQSFDEYAKLPAGVNLTQFNKTITGGSKIDTAKLTQQQLITEFKEWLNKVGYKGESDLPLVGHNIKRFDNEFLRQADASVLKINFNNSVDVYDLAKTFTNYEPFDMSILRELSPHINDYIHKQSTLSDRVINLVDTQTVLSMENTYKFLNKGNVDKITNLNNTLDLPTRLGLNVNLLNHELLDAFGSMDAYIKNVPEIIELARRGDLDYTFRLIDVKKIQEVLQTQTDIPELLGNTHVFLYNRLKGIEFENKFYLNKYATINLYKDYTKGLIDVSKLSGVELSQVTKFTKQVQRNLEMTPKFLNMPVEVKYAIVDKMDEVLSNNIKWQVIDDPKGRTVEELYAIYKAFSNDTTLDLKLVDSTFIKYRNPKLVDRILRAEADMSALTDAYNVLGNPDAVPALREDAIKYINAKGSNLDQLERATAAYNNYSYGFKDTSSIHERVLATLGTVENTAGTYQAVNIDLARAIGDVKDEVTDLISDDKAVREVKSILGSSPEQIVKTMNNNKIPILVLNDISNIKYSDLVESIKGNKNIFKQYGVDVYSDNYSLTLSLRRVLYEGELDNVNVISDLQTYSTKGLDVNTKTLIDADKAAFDKAYSLTSNKMITGSGNTAVKTVKPDEFAVLYNRLPEHITKNNILNTSVKYHREFYGSKTPLYSYMNLGDLKARRTNDIYYGDAFRNNITNLEGTLKRGEGAYKLLQLTFNQDVDLRGDLWKNVSDTELLSTLKKNKHLTTVLLRNTKKELPEVISYTPNNISDIKFIRDMGGVIVTNEMANTLKSTINVVDFKDLPFGLDVVASFWHKYVIGTYKTLYVSSVGLVVRNFNDIIVKNMVGGNITDIPEDIRYFFGAMRDWQKYDDTVKDIYRVYGSLTKESIDSYLSETGLSRVWFNEMDAYATSNITAGLATSQQKALQSFYDQTSTANVFEKAYANLIYEKNILFKEPMAWNTMIEHAGRLSKLRKSLDAGASVYKAYDDVLKTHFDYRTKNKAMLYAELAFPFVLFPINNLLFWIESALDNPWLIRNLIDVSVTSADVELQKQFTIDNSNQWQSILTGGNVLLGDTMWKLNPSFYDTLNLMYNPVDELSGRLIAPLKQLSTAITGSKEEEYTSDYQSNLARLGYGELEEGLNDWGLYTITRLANNVIKGVAAITDSKTLERTEHISDVVPSLTSQYDPNYGTKIGEEWRSILSPADEGYWIDQFQTTDNKHVSTKYGSYTPSYTAGRSYNRIPYVRSYYSGRSYNWYNSWKVDHVYNDATQATPTPEALLYRVKDAMYDMGANYNVFKHMTTRYEASSGKPFI